ncbi:MAG: HNH endonuclease [Patescibacteria group bacterium]|jgi:hypothetical protein
MQNLILQPSGSDSAKKHFEDTIKNGIDINLLKNYLSKDDIENIVKLYGGSKVEVWGVTPGKNNINVNKFDRSNVGDLVLFSANNKIIYISQLVYKLHNKNFAEHLWGFNSDNETWEYIYFLIDGTEENIPVSELNNLLGYKQNNVIRGYNVLDQKKSKSVLDRYGSFENAFSDMKTIFSEPTEKEIRKIEEESKKVIKIDDVDKILEKISQETKGKRSQEKTRLIKAVARNRKIVELIKQKYNYICQICGYEGFKEVNGKKYAEVHHKEELAISKIDHPDNMICVCPTCHRVIHYGTDEELEKRKKLKS